MGIISKLWNVKKERKIIIPVDRNLLAPFVDKLNELDLHIEHMEDLGDMKVEFTFKATDDEVKNVTDFMNMLRKVSGKGEEAT